MTKKIRIALAQLNLTVGDLEGNLQKHIAAATRARDELDAQLIVFPELSMTGYPPEDLLLRSEFITQAQAAVTAYIKQVRGIYSLISYPEPTIAGIHNACMLTHDGKRLGDYAKQCLPNYGVFDEYRYFIPGDKTAVLSIDDISFGLAICEDTWFSEPIHQAALEGARIILSPNASPFEVDKHEQRLAVLCERAKQDNVAIVYVNQVGGQDELIYDGGSMFIDSKGNISALAGFFQETILTVDVNVTDTEVTATHLPYQLPSTEEKIYQGLVLALRDYINKNHIPGVVLGLSGGIDSALTLAIAVDALGSERVKAVYLPSRYSAEISLEDAELMAANVKVPFDVYSIEPTFTAFLKTLSPILAGTKPDITEENIQARCRAIILMAISNKSGYLVLTTGNHSEVATGYCSLYGDMVGGFDVLKDIPKTLVFALAAYRNSINTIIPTRTIEREPTAELALNQKDEDSLPPYAVLDRILQAYTNQSKTADQIIAEGFEAATVHKVIRLVQNSEFKRRQAAIGPRINQKSFGRDWRFPITNGFKG